MAFFKARKGKGRTEILARLSLLNGRISGTSHAVLLESNRKMTTPDYPKAYLYKRIVAAKLFMDSNFSDDIDLHNISDEACFSRFHFIRLFKAIYEKTPHQYLISVRIEAAKKLLQQERSVSVACFSVGFDSLSSFSGLFKRYTKQSPSKYSQACAARQEQIREIPLRFIPACFADQHGWTEKKQF